MIIKQPFSGSTLPEYQQGTLIVKVRPSIGGPIGGMSIAAIAEGSLTTPGIAALSFFERGGLIKKVTALGRSRSSGQPRMMPAGTALSIMAAADSNKSDANAGVSLVELERDQDVGELQIALANDPNVEFVSRVPVRYLAITGKSRIAGQKRSAASGQKAGTGVAAVPPPASTMWNLAKIEWQAARATAGFSEAQTIRVGVLDTGVDQDHPDLIGRVSGYEFVHPDFPGASGNRDIIGHGTHVSGSIMANSANALGINGICTCELQVWKIFDDEADFAGFDDGYVYFVDTAMYHRALADCVDQSIDVINLSIGGQGKPDANEKRLFENLLANGTAVIAAMGNERQFGSPTSYPAAIPGVIAVGATSLDDKVANFSNRGNHISLVAPGVSIWSTLPTYPGRFGFAAVPGPNGKPVQGMEQRRETDYDSWNGTSMATPHVTAATALLLANKEKMNPAAVRQKLMASADKTAGMNGNNFHPDYGAGRLNLLNLLT